MSDELQVIGVGLHRTGSMSVKAALERLGFGPCYHGMEALRRCRDGDHWLAAYAANGRFDWRLIFDGYRAAMDWPTVYFWEQLAAAYPNAKILLTHRDPDSWWTSHVEMFERGMAFGQQLNDAERQWAADSGFAQMQLALGTIAAAPFDGRLYDKDHCLHVFDEHYDRIRQTVPAERLLEYRVREGWAPLCRFLEVKVPDEPFPRVNVGNNLVHNMRTAMDAARAHTEDVVWH